MDSRPRRPDLLGLLDQLPDRYRLGLHPGRRGDPAHRSAEAKTLVERVEARFDLTPERYIGDTAYGAGPMLAWLVDEKAIAPHVPVWDKSERTDGTFSRSDFQGDAAADVYRCPAGKAPRSRQRQFKAPRTRVTKDNPIIYRASQRDCRTCPLKSQCCPNIRHRKIARSIHEAAGDGAGDIANTPEYRQSRCERKARRSRCSLPTSNGS